MVGLEGVVRRVEVDRRLRGPVARVEHRYVGAALGVEIYCGHLAEAPYGVFHRSRDDLPHSLFVLKLNLGLCRVYVHIDVCRVHFDVDEIRHLHAHGHQTVESVHHSLVEVWVLHIPSVDEEILMHALLSRRLRLAHIAAYAAQGRVYLHRQQVLAYPAAEHVGYALPEAARAQVHHFRPIAVQREADGGIDEHYALISRHDVV